MQVTSYYPTDPNETLTEHPPLRPVVTRERIDSVAGCALCQVELQAAEPGEREGHVCNHPGGGDGNRQDDENSVHGSEGARLRVRGLN